MEDIKTLSIDIETFSTVDLKKAGVYKYAESDDFEILLFAYSINGGDVKVIDLARGENIPSEIVDAIKNETIIKWAFNASFERICLSKYLGIKYLSPSSWRCSMIWCRVLGFPSSLEKVSEILNLKNGKLSVGKSLIRYFSLPVKPSKANCYRTRNLPEHDIDKWHDFVKYNRFDVLAELEIKERLSKFPVPDNLWREYVDNEIINDLGIKVDAKFVKSAIRLAEDTANQEMNKLKEITGLSNPNSVKQLKGWLLEKGIEVESLNKASVDLLIKENSGEIKEVLKIRKKLSKSSVKKYIAMKTAMCSDERLRGMFSFYGASRTGRFSGRIVQLQNLPRNYMPDLAEARELVKTENYSAIYMLYDFVASRLSEMVRTAFIPRESKKFIVADFSAIEARVIAFIAGESWRLEVFKNGGDIYCSAASNMFHVPVEKNGINGHLRQKGKIAELACGYGGSVGALISMGALDMGLEEDELKPLVTAWRNSNPNITRLWWDVDSAVKDCIRRKRKTYTHGIYFEYLSGILFIRLPSGRNLAYIKPRIEPNKYGTESVTYEGVGTNKKWERIESYGPKFVENIIQAISRDILCFAIKELKEYDIVAHIHDEVIIEADKDEKLDDVIRKMSKSPPWLKNIFLSADGYECEFYKKD